MSGVIQKDFVGALETVYHWDEHTQEIHVERCYDAEPLLEKIKRLRSLGFSGHNSDRSMRALSEVPLTLLEQWRAEGVDFLNPDHSAEIERRLRSPDLSGFRLDLEGSMQNGILVTGKR